jgi:hypothetical protein
VLWHAVNAEVVFTPIQPSERIVGAIKFGKSSLYYVGRKSLPLSSSLARGGRW